MAVLKCKMCGGDLEISEGVSVCECEYCGTKQTLPRLDDERKTNLYDRANHFRRNNEFDKAESIYEQILSIDMTDAEAYWSLVLCRYGIEYVEDPLTHKRVPTVNRAQFTSIFDDDNYKSALQYADALQSSVYKEEANAINEIQKGILAISQKEDPFDVFICYKETDRNNRRTHDSVLANDLYHQLTQEGFKVFFARITLEDKLGSAYEPYIFAALNSAKVMIVLGTKPEYFNAVWVKNEWSRYLALVKKSGGKKTLIPAYKDMDPYDLPEEFSHLQAQDMSKLGFLQDMIRGIKKIISSADPKQAQAAASGSTNVAPLLKRAFMFLEDGKWKEADEYCEKVLDHDPENARAYVGKLMAELRVRRQENLTECKLPFDENNYYSKAMRFGDEKLKNALTGYNTQIKERNDLEHRTEVYQKAVASMEAANSVDTYKEAASAFDTIQGFKDADALAEQCLEKAEFCRKDDVYHKAVSLMHSKDEAEILKAIPLFESISGWQDSDALAKECPGLAHQLHDQIVSDLVAAADNLETIDSLMSNHPDYWIIPWKGVQLVLDQNGTGELTHESIKKEKETDVKKMLEDEIPTSYYDRRSHGAAMEQVANEMKELSEKWKQFPQSVRDAAEKYLSKALEIAGDKAPEIQSKWEAYIHAIDNLCSQNEQQYLGYSEQLLTLKAKYDENENIFSQKQLVKKTISSAFCTAFSVILVGAMAGGVLYASQSIGNPERLLHYSTVGYAIFASLLALAGGAIAMLIQRGFKKICNNYYNNFRLPDDPSQKVKRFGTMKTVCLISIIATVILAVTAAYFSIRSAITFNESIGTITISSAEDFSLINMHPGASFVITEDIDFEGNKWSDINSIHGSIDGGGHTLSNIVLEKYLIGTCSGSITDLRLSNVVIAGSEVSLIEENSGTINKLFLENVTTRSENNAWYGIIEENKGTVTECCVLGIEGSFERFFGLAKHNKPGATLINCEVTNVHISTNSAGGFGGSNNGTVKKCSFRGDIIGNYDVSAFLDANTGTIEESCAYGSVYGGQIVSGFIGSFSKGKILNCFSQVDVTQHTIEFGSSVSGFVSKLYPNSDGSLPLLIDRCYYSGTITVVKGEAGDTYKALGGLVSGFGGPETLNGIHALTIRNSFCLANYSLAVSRGGDYSGAKFITKFENFYGTSNNDYETKMEISGSILWAYASTMKSRGFILDTLEWNEDIWEVADGSLPTLKYAGAPTALLSPDPEEASVTPSEP